MRIPLLEKTDAYEFKPRLAEIEERPVSPMGRSIIILILITILFFALWMYFGMIDIVVSARGTIIADGQNKIVQPLDTGVVSNIMVKEGDAVKKGQPLMEIDPSTTRPEMESTDENLRYAQLEINRIKATVTGGDFAPSRGRHDWQSLETQERLFQASTTALQRNLASKEAELRSLDSQIASESVERQKNEDLLKVAQTKEERLSQVLDIIAKDDYEKVKNDIVTFQDNIAQANHKVAQLTHQQAQVR